MAKLKNLDPNDIIKVEPVKRPDAIIEVEGEEIEYQENSVIPVFEHKGIEETEAQKTLALFSSAFEELAKWENYEKSIVVKDENDYEAMDNAKFVRKNVAQIRLRAKDTKEELKRPLLYKGDYIQNIFNTINILCKKIEDSADEKEKYLENLMNQKRQRVLSERSLKLIELEYNFKHLDLINMPDEVFEETLENAKILFDAKTKKRNEEIEEQKRKDEEAEKQRESDRLKAYRFQKLSENRVASDKDIEKMSDDEFSYHLGDLIKARDLKEEEERNNKLEEVKRGQEISKRKDSLYALGMIRSIDDYYFESKFQPISCKISKLEIESDEKTWKSILKKTTLKIDSIKQADQKIQDEKDRNKKINIERSTLLKTIRIELLKDVKWDNLWEFSEENFSTMFDLLKIESEKIIKKENELAEIQKREELSDKENVKLYFEELLRVHQPEVKNKSINKRIQELNNHIRREKEAFSQLFTKK